MGVYEVTESFLLGPNGQMTKLQGPRGTTPDVPEALFAKNEVVRVRRLKHLRDLPEDGVVVAVVPPHISPDHVWDDLCGKPRRLMHRVPLGRIGYFVAFEGNQTAYLLREKNLAKSKNERTAVVKFAANVIASD